MANINLSGVLRDPLGEVSYGNTVKFTHETTTGETIGGFASALIVEINGAYDIDLEYGNVLIESYDKINSRWIKHGTFTINSETPATSLPELIGVTNPLTDPELLIVQNLVADAQAAKNEAEQAQSDTEDLFNNFGEAVAQQMAVNSPSNIAWDLHIPFNDGVELSKGYGNRNTYGNKSADFTRLSGSSVINKSGDFEFLAEGEEAISSGGIEITDGYFNYLLNSGDLTSNSFTSTRSLIVGGYDGVSGDGFKLTFDTTTAGTGYLNQTINNLPAGTYTFRIQAKKGELDQIRLYFVGSISGVIGDTGAVDLTDDYEIYYTTATITEEETMQARVIQLEAGSDGTSGFYLCDPQVSNSDVLVPYIESAASIVSAAPTLVSFLIKNNLPTNGDPFLILADAKVPIGGGDSRIFSQFNLFTLRVNGAGFLNSVTLDGSGAQKQATSPFENDGEKHTYGLRFDGETIALFIDGVKVNETTSTGIALDFTKSIYIGSYAGTLNFINGPIEEFRAKIGFVTDEQILAIGGPNDDN